MLGKHWFGSIDLTSISVRLPRFQLFSAENKMNSWSYSTGDTPHKTESNSTCIQVKQVPIFPHGWGSKDSQSALSLHNSLSVCHLFLLSSDFISSADRLTYKIVWLQFQGLNIFIDLRIFFLIFVFSFFFPPLLTCVFWISRCLENSMKSSRHVLRNAHKDYDPCCYPSATTSCGFCILHVHAGDITSFCKNTVAMKACEPVVLMGH